MRKASALTLGVLTAIGGFVDVGDFVTNALVGARFGMSLAWVVVLGVAGIILFAEMAGRVAAITHRPVFDLIRERLGVRAALANLVASFFINFLTLTAEIAGVALALELATSVHYLLWIPLVGFLIWWMVWRVPFEQMERIFGLLGVLLVIFAVALWQLGPNWGALLSGAADVAPPEQVGGYPTYFYYGIALFGAAMTPYEVFFFSSGGVEEHWSMKDLRQAKINVFIGFPLGALISLSIMATATLVLFPNGITVETLDQAMLPVAMALGKLGLAAVLIGAFAAFSGAALETLLSSGYTISQYFGWSWGKLVSPARASRFHVTMLITLLGAMMLALTSVDPIKVTEYSVVLSAAALPLTYFPILVVANDSGYMGEHTNGRLINILATAYLLLIIVVAVVTIPLMITTMVRA